MQGADLEEGGVSSDWGRLNLIGEMMCGIAACSLLQSWRQINHSLKENDRIHDERNRNGEPETRWLTKTGHKRKPRH